MQSPRSGGGIPRREFVKAAVAIGGSAALSACLDRTERSVPTGPSDLASLPLRQHAWNDALSTDDHGNVLPPRHHVLLALNYRRGGPPSEADRDTVERAFRSLDRAYERSNRGLLFTVAYSPAYFERFGRSLPASVDLPRPEALAPFEDPEPDRSDAIVHLASDAGSVVLGAEEALFGRADSINGVDVRASIEGAFERVDRRTGFVGAGLPADNQDVAGVPDSKPVSRDAPLYMGFKSGFRKNQATEDRVTIRTGPFAGGTTQHVSRLALDLEQWYEQDGRFERVAKMFCPAHAASSAVEGTGDNLGDSSGMADCPPADRSARGDGVVGHSQKMVAAREDDRPIILRRDFDSTDGGRAGLHFVALQRGIGDFAKTRRVMNGGELPTGSAVGQRNNNGILQYITVERRGNFLVPPRDLRALPPARPDA
ncbi:MAG: Tat pathway signal protein [Salinigranum sp.]